MKRIQDIVSLYYYENILDYNLLLIGDHHLRLYDCDDISKSTQNIYNDDKAIDVSAIIGKLLVNPKTDLFFENPVNRLTGGTYDKMSAIYKIPIKYNNCFNSLEDNCELYGYKFRTSQFNSIDVRNFITYNNLHPVVGLIYIWNNFIENFHDIGISNDDIFSQLYNLGLFMIGEKTNDTKAINFLNIIRLVLQKHTTYYGNKQFNYKIYSTKEIINIAKLVQSKLKKITYVYALF